MKKYDITDWCDFVRGLSSPAEEESMQSQLEASPADRRTVELLQRVAAVGRADQALEIPEHAVRGAKAIGSLARPETVEAAPTLSSLLRRLSFNITFDSLLQPVPVGTRDLHSAHRQIFFEADAYTVDVRWEQEADPQYTAVIGQVLQRQDTVIPATGMPVYVVADGEIVGRAQSNRFGEFQADKLPKKALKLCLVVSAEECLELPLAVNLDVGDEKV